MSNRTILLRWLAAVFMMLFASACMQNLFDARRGKVAISVKWPPGAGYSVMAIPEGTVRIDVEIVGEGLETGPLKESLTPQNSDTSTKFIEVPIGPKVVQATGYDVTGKVTASGQKAIEVKPNALTEARVILTANGPVIIVDRPGEPRDPAASPSYELAIETAAGDGQPGAVDGGDPLSARFKYPQSLAYSAKDNVIYVADTENRLIRRFDLTTQAVTTVAGLQPTTDAAPTPAATGAPALLGSTIGVPTGLAVDPQGVVYFADRDSHQIRKLQPGGAVVAVAGSGQSGSKDGASPLAASFYYPVALAFDKFGTMYVADHLNHKIRRVSPSGTVTTLAGTGAPGHTGDNGLAVEAQIQFPVAVAVDPDSRYLYFAEGRFATVRRVDLSSGMIQTVAGSGRFSTDGEDGPALEADMALPTALAFTREGELLIAEGWALKAGPEASLGITSRVLKLTKDGKLVRIAGQVNDANGFSGDGGDARLAELYNPAGLAVDGDGHIYVADSYNNRIRVLKPVQVAPAPAPGEPPPPSPAPATGAASL